MPPSPYLPPGTTGAARTRRPAVQTLPTPTAPGVAAPRLAGVRAALAALFSLDFTRPLPAVALAVLFVVTRAPLLDDGYGADADAWRVAITARWLWDHGQYLPSRLPGYPLHELCAALLIRGGWPATNMATMLVSLAGVFLFAAIVRRCRVEPKGLLTLTFAFTPLLWINSTVTMDYLWGLTFVLAAYLALLHGRHTLAGVLLGAGAGFRPTSAAFLGPFLIVVLRERTLGAAARLVGATLLTATVAFAPVWLRYGTRMFAFADWRPPWGQVARTLGVETAGLMVSGGLLVLLVVSLPRLRRLPGLIRRDGHFAAWLAAALLILAIFVRLPLEEGYLVAAVPFALLAAARLLSRPVLVAACTLVLLGGFLDIHTASREGWRSPTAVLYLRPQPGRVLVDRALRTQRMAIVREARRYPLPDNAVLTMGYYYPIMAELFHDELTLRFREELDPRIIGPLTDITEAVDDRNRAYVWLLTEGQVRRYRRQGYTTWTMDYDGERGLEVEQTLNPALDRFGPR
jgi:hypothetical protein